MRRSGSRRPVAALDRGPRSTRLVAAPQTMLTRTPIIGLGFTELRRVRVPVRNDLPRCRRTLGPDRRNDGLAAATRQPAPSTVRWGRFAPPCRPFEERRLRAEFGGMLLNVPAACGKTRLQCRTTQPVCANCGWRDTAVIGKSEVSYRSSAPSDLPEVIRVEITVPPNPDAGTLRERIAAIQKIPRWSAVVALALLVATLAMAVTLPGARDGGRHVVSALARQRGPAGVAAAYGYPLRCLSITISGIDQRYARADFNHMSPCGRFTGYSTAIFLRVMGAWRPVLKAVSYVCPFASLPVDVQTELGVCPRPSGQTPHPQPR